MLRDEILEFIREYYQTKKVPPSIREILDGTNASSTSHVQYWLKELDRDGEIEYRQGQARGAIPK